MRLWRISDFSDLSGQGGLLGPARWHSLARPVVYLADHPASALLEVLVHLEVDRGDLPDSYQLLAVEIPDSISSDETPALLRANWRSNANWSQQIGNRWLESGVTALLRVPSAIVPYASNWLLNPRHAEAGLARVVDVIRTTFDPRLFG